MTTPLDPLLAEAVSPFSDEEIVKRVLEGDTAVFELIVRRYNQRLFRATRAILRDDGEAEDVMQEAYVRAFVNLDQFAGDAKFSTWLTKIAVYEALGRLRRVKRQEELAETMDSSDNPERTAYGRELQSAIESAVDALPPLYRTVFVLREVEEMSVAETAECLGITEERSQDAMPSGTRVFAESGLNALSGCRRARHSRFSDIAVTGMTQRVMERIVLPPVVTRRRRRGVNRPFGSGGTPDESRISLDVVNKIDYAAGRRAERPPFRGYFRTEMASCCASAYGSRRWPERRLVWPNAAGQ